MIDTCTTCGRTGSESIADARSLGLEQEFQSGIHTCCKIAEWADEQALAWFKATHEDDTPAHHGTELEPEPEAVLVRVRRRPTQVPWFRNSDGLR